MWPPFDMNELGSTAPYGSTSSKGSSWFSWLAPFGLSAVLSQVFSAGFDPYNAIRLFLLGSLVETGRRLSQWLIQRCRIQYCITMEFNEGDASYEWMLHFLTQEQVWRRSREFRVNSKSSKLKWGIKPANFGIDGNADYVPTYELPQVFWWRGYFLEIKRTKGSPSFHPVSGQQSHATIFVSIYSLDMSVMSALVEEARQKYLEVSRPHVIVHLADSHNFGPDFIWNNSKAKVKRPLSSIILDAGVIESLVKDTQEFLASEDWYIEAGIPHRRGYLLYGPPGTGKTSTIYALAGELGLEIYSLSLASNMVDDNYLQRAASSMPKGSIFLIEDIDCCFSREDEDDQQQNTPQSYPGILGPFMPKRKSSVSLSGLLNVIDGVGSEDGKLFFATTNYVDRLDPALLRPGRIDKKIQYHLATKDQASALFRRFFPESRSTLSSVRLAQLASQFAARIPEDEFSTAELQGFLLSHKKQPVEAADGVDAWVEQERQLRREKEDREEARKEKARLAKVKREGRDAAVIDLDKGAEGIEEKVAGGSQKAVNGIKRSANGFGGGMNPFDILLNGQFNGAGMPPFMLPGLSLGNPPLLTPTGSPSTGPSDDKSPAVNGRPKVESDREPEAPSAF